ncbi:MAG: hypothetical protein KatS3mg029_0306 [Saprospiraceae bacterium]|nr:MAG: hypothetical protein KatS3mg029_0306 [Saprospiraceae bacterium]
MKNATYESITFSKARNSRENWITSFLFLLCLLLSLCANAQGLDPLSKANAYLKENLRQMGLTSTDVGELLVSDAYSDARTNVQHIYVQQQYKNIPIHNAILGLHFDAEGQVIFVGNSLQKKIEHRIKSTTPRLSPAEALQSSCRHLELPPVKSWQEIHDKKISQNKWLFDGRNISLENIPVELVFFPHEDGSIRLTYKVSIYTLDAKHYFQSFVDANSGEVLHVDDLVLHCHFNHFAQEDHDDASHSLGAASAQADAMVPHVLHGGLEAAASPTAHFVTTNFYRVYPPPVEAPTFGSRVYIGTSGDPVASPMGWHYDGNVQYLITRGNNVYAYEDKNNVNAGTSPLGGVIPGQPLNFDFPVDLTQHPHSYTDAAITNLFYWNNYIHDVMYHYGFTEAAGNFQVDNLGKGGIGNDAVMAEAQDGGGTNNANFLTLPDGVPGRMQMYLWTSNESAELVHIQQSPSHPNGNVSFVAVPAAFGPEITTTGVTAELVLVEANVNSASSCNSCGCGTGQGVGLPPNNDVQGKIVLIDRGGCTFIEKVQGAQMGGAVGVIVVNNVPGAPPIAMGGSVEGGSATILIPSVMISYEDGQQLKDELTQGTTIVSLKRLTPAPPMKDGDFDNGVITHEYGHGISIRLTGGPSSTCLGGDEQAGEGWSDYFALMLTMDPATIATIGAEGRGVGSYVFSQPPNGQGIRPAKYSTDFAVNDYTYADIANPEISVPHGVGFIFATALWEMTIKLIEEYGYTTDIYSADLTKGNTLALQLVIQGLKLQPCSPTFLESRDAILAADMALTGGANQCLIWEAFAKRGMGYSAVSGTNSRGDEIEAFDLPPTCLPNVVLAKTATPTVHNGQTLHYTIVATNLGGLPATGVSVSDPLPAGTTYVAGTATQGGTLSGNTLVFPPQTIGPGQSVVYEFDVVVNTPTASNVAFFDDIEDGINNWNRSIGVDMWNLSSANAHSGSYAWFAADPNNASNQILETDPLTLPTTNPRMHFWHNFNTEAGFDGGVVEISNDGGITWYDLGPLMIQNGYTDFIPVANNPLIGGFAFGGNSNGWIETIVDLNAFKGQEVIVRFRFSSDVLTPGHGWYIDDVVIGSTLTFVNNTASFVTSTGDQGQASTSTLVLTPSQNHSLPQISQDLQYANAEASKPLEVLLWPNPTSDQVNVRLFHELHVMETTLRLISVEGKELKRITTSGLEATMNLDGMPPGMYLLHVQNAAGVAVRRLVVD